MSDEEGRAEGLALLFWVGHMSDEQEAEITPIISRAVVAAVLRHWQAGEWSAEQVHTWAEDRFGQVDVDDWEGAEEQSVANEVLAALDMLDMHLILPEDIPIYLHFLQTPAGQFAAGYQTVQDALEQIDYRARQQALQAIPLYAPFCR